MKVIPLEKGRLAPDNSDRLIINELPNGKYGVTAITASREARSAGAFFNYPNDLATAAAAEWIGTMWAEQHEIELLYIEHNEA